MHTKFNWKMWRVMGFGGPGYIWGYNIKMYVKEIGYGSVV
jgi:hypothetical protein